MTGSAMSTWRLILRSYPCRTCGAGPGDPCTTSGGREADLEHVDRQQHVGRCPRCATMMDADWTPGALCPHCQLLRSLQVERYTHHRRST